MIPYMTIPALRSLGQTSAEYADMVVTHLDLSYDDALHKYVTDAHAFRGHMRMLGAVISGSFALAFLLRNTEHAITPGDMDVYVPGEFAVRFAAYLVEVEGYAHTETSTIPYGRSTAHRHVIVLEKGHRRIDVVPSVNNCALYAVSHFWSSHVMNYLAADTYGIAYPESTFQGRGLLSPFQLMDLRHTSAYVIDLIRKYEARGFTFRVRSYAWDEDGSSSRCSQSEGCSRVRRFFGDRYCALGRLSRAYEDGGFPRGLPSGSTVCWWRGGDPCGVECEFGGILPERAVPAAIVVEAKTLPDTL